MMATHADSRSFVETCVFLTLLVAVHAAPQEVCDKTKCPGPLGLYKQLGCTPVYKNPGDCCAERYNCSHLKELSKHKCYVNGHGYSLGEILRPEHRNLCDLPCVCEETDNDFSVFDCGIHYCPSLPDLPNCYYRNSHSQCCAELQVCLKEDEERSTCEVNGQVYKDGESFQPESDPENDCICMPGYKGENVEPFCKKRNRKQCDPLFADPYSIHANCAPIYYNDEDPQTECNPVFRCQNSDDIVIHNDNSTKSSLEIDEDDMCRFGNLTMHRGDELNQGIGYSPICVKCVCEVPPWAMCQQISFDECSNSSELETQNILKGGDSEDAEE